MEKGDNKGKQTPEDENRMGLFDRVL